MSDWSPRRENRVNKEETIFEETLAETCRTEEYMDVYKSIYIPHGIITFSWNCIISKKKVFKVARKKQHITYKGKTDFSIATMKATCYQSIHR